ASWMAFVRERDSANRRIEEWNMYIELENSHLLRTLEEAEMGLDDIKLAYANFDAWREEVVDDLQEIANSLSPAELPLNEIRFINVAIESTDQEFEKLLDALFTEFRVEEELQHERNLIEEEVSEMEGRCVLLIDDNDVDGLRRLLFELNSVGAHIAQLIQDVANGVENRTFVAIGAGVDGESLRDRVDAIEMRVRGYTDSLSPSDTDAESPVSPPQGNYDVEAAAEILAALYPDEHPRDVLRDRDIAVDDDGIGDTESESPSDFSSPSPPRKSEDEALGLDVGLLEEGGSSSSNTAGLLSPIPDDPIHDTAVSQAHFRRQRSRWRRILRTALPLQAMLVLLLGAACLVPHCDDEYCCMLLNRFANSFDPSLEFVNGPPPF
uniref:KASH domain-containing protein n=1 Tax=Steinernema glaseri TaxID=37863 RepID=A0A1I7ZVH9_9BILA